MNIQIQINPAMCSRGGDYYDAEVSFMYEDMHDQRVIEKRIFMKQMAWSKAMPVVHELEDKIKLAIYKVVKEEWEKVCEKYPRAQE